MVLIYLVKTASERFLVEILCFWVRLLKHVFAECAGLLDINLLGLVGVSFTELTGAEVG